MARELFQSHLTELERIEPARNAFRYYQLALWPDLFGGISLVRERGRIGQSSQIKLEPYPNAGAASEAFQQRVRQKRRRGSGGRMRANGRLGAMTPGRHIGHAVKPLE